MAKTIKKRDIRHRQPRGAGGVEWILQPDGTYRYRARKFKKLCRRALGTVRDTLDEALDDRQYLDWDETGEPFDTRTKPATETKAPAEILFRDFMLEVLDTKRHDTLSYGSWQRDEIAWRQRVWHSKLGKTSVGQIDEDIIAEFMEAQRKFKPYRDNKGKIRLFEQDANGQPDLKRPVERGRSRARIWITQDSTHCRILREGDWGIEALSPVPAYYASSERPAIATLKVVGATLSAYFEIARKAPYRLLRDNPISRYEYPKPRKGARQKKSLTVAQAAHLQSNIIAFTNTLREQGQRFEAMIVTARDTGMRRGEIAGLLRSSVFPRRKNKRPYIVVDNGRVRVPGGMDNSTPKTGRFREIPIPDPTYELIMTMPVQRDPDTGQVFAFTTASGRPVRPDNFSRDFRKFREQIGMPMLKLHHLRHTYISMMLRAGVDVRTIMELVGHTTEKMILQVYSEIMNDSADLAVGRFLQLLDEERKSAAGSVATGTGEVIHLS